MLLPLPPPLLLLSLPPPLLPPPPPLLSPPLLLLPSLPPPLLLPSPLLPLLHRVPAYIATDARLRLRTSLLRRQSRQCSLGLVELCRGHERSTVLRRRATQPCQLIV